MAWPLATGIIEQKLVASKFIVSRAITGCRSQFLAPIKRDHVAAPGLRPGMATPGISSARHRHPQNRSRHRRAAGQRLLRMLRIGAERATATAESSRTVRRKHSHMGPRIIHQAARAHRPGALRRAQGRDAASLSSTNTAVSDVDAQLRSNNIDNRPIFVDLSTCLYSGGDRHASFAHSIDIDAVFFDCLR